MESNESPQFSSISLYARPSESLNAMFAIFNETHLSGENNAGENNADAANESNSLNLLSTDDSTPSNTPSTSSNTEWSVHRPETRTIFQNLKSKLNDIESVYKKHDSSINHTVVPTSDIITQKQKMQESVDFFREKILMYYDKFAECQLQCEREQAFLAHCSSLLDAIQSPSLDENDFNECASTICKSLSNFTDKISTRITENMRNREIYWSQYKELRDTCNLLKEIQSDVVCQICMTQEVDMALSCGHCFCTGCASRCNVCPNCRVCVKQKLKLYF